MQIYLKFMTFKDILENYPKQDYPSNEDLSVIVVNILRVLAERENIENNINNELRKIIK